MTRPRASSSREKGSSSAFVKGFNSTTFKGPSNDRYEGH